MANIKRRTFMMFDNKAAREEAIDFLLKMNIKFTGNVSLNNDVATLLSYNTPICEFNIATNDFKMVYTEKISNTTSSHIKAFKQFYNIN
jgi:hypothetical protein